MVSKKITDNRLWSNGGNVAAIAFLAIIGIFMVVMFISIIIDHIKGKKHRTCRCGSCNRNKANILKE